MSTERIEIVIREDGSRVVKRSIDDIGTSAEKTERSVTFLKRALAGVASVVVLNELRKLADEYTHIQNRLRLVTTDQSNLNDVFNALQAISTRTRSSLSANAELYTRIAVSAKELGVSQQELLTFTERLNQAIKISGANAQEAEAGLVQLSQGMASGTLRGDELRSVLEQLPAVADVISESLGVTRGQLRLLGSEGKITAGQILKAFRDVGPELAEKFAKTVPTIAESFVVLRNKVVEAFGKMEQSIGASKAISKVLIEIADNMEAVVVAGGKLIGVLATAAATYATFVAATKVTALGERIAEFIAYRQAIASGMVVQLGSAEAEKQRAAAALAGATATQAATAAQVASDAALARSAAQATAARVAESTATQAALVVAREEAVAKLAKANADVIAAKKAQEAAAAAGAQSYALKILKQSTIELAVAEEARAAVLGELAILGQQQVRINAEAAAAAVANATAQTAMNEAQATGSALNAAAAANTARASAASATATAAAASGTSLLAQAYNALKNAATTAGAALLRLLVIINANPFTVLITALVAVIGLLAVFGGDIHAGVDSITSLNDVLIALALTLYDAIAPLGSAIADAFRGVLTVVTKVLDQIGVVIGPAVESYLKSFDGFFDGVGTGFAGVLKGTARVFDAIGGLLIGFGLAIQRTFGGLPAVIGAAFKSFFNLQLGLVENFLNAIVGAVNSVREKIGLSLIEAVKIQKLEVDKKAFQDYGANIASSIDDGFKMQGGALEKSIDDVLKQAQHRAAERELQEFHVTARRIEDPAQVKPAGPDPKEVDKAANALRRLLDTIDPISGALLEMAKAEKTLNDAVKFGLITGEQKAAYLVRLKDYYQDILDPLGKVNRDLDDETHLLGLNNREREVEAQVLQISAQLRRDLGPLTEAETTALREKLTAMQRLNEVVDAQDNILQQSVEKRRDFATQLVALQKLMANPPADFNSSDVGGTVSGIIDNMGLDSSTLQAHANMMVGIQATMYDQIKQLRDANLISEQEAAGLRAQVWAQGQADQLEVASNFFGQLSQLQKSENSKLAAIGKAAAISQALINTYQSATAAYSAMAAIPYVGPALGAAAAAAAIVAGLANVAQIRSQPTGFMTGGDFKVGGRGGPDSQMVAFRATPGEHVRVSTPQQVRKGGERGAAESSPAPQVNLRNVNIIDPALFSDYMQSAEGEQVLVNTMRRNGFSASGQ